jgi:hypothetical protein
MLERIIRGDFVKLSNWIKNHDWQFPGDKLRIISCNDLLYITDFDVQNQSLKSEKQIEVPYTVCKHTQIYTLFDPTEETKDKMKNIEDDKKSSLKSFIKTLRNPREVYYHELTEEFKAMVDEDWNKYDPTRCDATCSNIVTDNH